MATHSSILAWRIPWTEGPGGLHSPWGCKQLDRTEQLNNKLSTLESTGEGKKVIIILCNFSASLTLVQN